MKFIYSMAVATALAAAAVSAASAASANAAPSGPATADTVVTALQAQGDTVVVNRMGSRPLSECVVAGVRRGQTFTRFDSGYPGAQNVPRLQIQSTTVYVDARC